MFSGTSPDGHLVEFVELPADKQPVLRCHAGTSELKSRPTRPHPLFSAFIGAALDYKAAEQLPVEVTDVSASSPADAAEAATADSVG